MSVISGPKLQDNDLLLYYDFYNKKKSFIGKPITNQYAIPTPVSNGDVTFAINGTGTFKRIYAGTFGGYTIQPTDVVYRYDLGTSGCHYHGNSATITAGQYATFTFDYFVSEDAGNYPETNYLANMENSGSGAGGAAAAPNSLKGVWQTVTFSSNAATSTGGINMYLYPGACNPSRLASSGYILYKNPQVIFSSSTNDTAPYASGTRSTSQSVIDIAKKNTITLVGNPTFNSNSITIPNSNSVYLELSNPSAFRMGTNNFTLSFWLKQLDNGAHVLLEARDSNLLGYLFILNYTSAGYISVFLNHNSTQQPYYSNVGTLTTGTVQNIVAVVNRTDAKVYLYVNGVLWDTITGIHANSISGTTGDMYRIGYDRGGSTQNFELYSQMHFSRALTTSEVEEHFNNFRGRYGL